MSAPICFPNFFVADIPCPRHFLKKLLRLVKNYDVCFTNVMYVSLAFRIFVRNIVNVFWNLLVREVKTMSSACVGQPKHVLFILKECFNASILFIRSFKTLYKTKGLYTMSRSLFNMELFLVSVHNYVYNKICIILYIFGILPIWVVLTLQADERRCRKLVLRPRHV